MNKDIIRNTVLSQINFNDRRHKSALVLDVETTLAEGNETAIFDIGWTVSHLTRQEMVMHRSYVIEDVFLNMKIMARAHYFEKYPQYVRGLITGQIEMVTWEYARAKLEEDINNFNVSGIFAYNASFDKGAISATHKLFNEQSNFDLDMKCIMVGALSHIVDEDYVRLAHSKGWFTESGISVKVSAECVYRYLFEDYDFIEEHTGLQDSIIETKILWKIHAMKGAKEYTIGAKGHNQTRKLCDSLKDLHFTRKIKKKQPKEWVKLSNAKTKTYVLVDRIVKVDVEMKGE